MSKSKKAAPLFAPRGVPSANTNDEVLAGAEETDAAQTRTQLLEAAVADLDCTIQPFPYGFQVVVTLGARTQRVEVIYENADDEGDPLILVYTLCGPAREHNLRWALRCNLRLPFGKIALRRVGDHDEFVFVHTLLESHTQAAELRKAVKQAAERGDWIETVLTQGRDIR